MTSHRSNITSIADKVFEKIENGDIKMKSRRYFIIKFMLMVVGVVLALLSALFLLSFSFFILHVTGALFLPQFGMSGLLRLTGSLPWMILIFAFLFIFLAEVLCTSFSIVYKRPVMYSFAGLLLLVSVGSLIIYGTSFHHKIWKGALRENIPILSPVYKAYGKVVPRNGVAGRVTNIDKDGFVLQTGDDINYKVLITSHTKLIPPKEIHENDDVYCFCNEEDRENTMQAVGIRFIDTEQRGNVLPFVNW